VPEINETKPYSESDQDEQIALTAQEEEEFVKLISEKIVQRLAERFHIPNSRSIADRSDEFLELCNQVFDETSKDFVSRNDRLNPSKNSSRFDTPLAQSQAAYIADLPEMLKHHPHEWVAYADGKQLRFGKTQSELYQYCLKDLGLTHDHFVVRLIVPECDPTIEYNLR
jgi:hypothetical protein